MLSDGNQVNYLLKMKTPRVFEAIQQNPQTIQHKIQNVQNPIQNNLTYKESEKCEQISSKTLCGKN